LAGAVVIVALVVIFVPMLFEEDSLAPSLDQSIIPGEPDLGDRFGAAPPLQLPLEGSDGLADDPAESETGASMGGDSDVQPAGAPGQIDLQLPALPSRSAEPEPDRPARQAAQKPAAPSKPPSAPPQKPAVVKQKPVAPIAPPPRGPSDGMPSWVVQVASLGAIEKANGLASKLKKSGFSAFVEKAEVRGKTYYRVRVGPELDRANAERTAAMLRQRQKLDTLIQRYPSN